MAKLPVNFLLYSLYAVAAGLVGGIGYTFYTTYKLKERHGDPTFRKQISAEVDRQVKTGRDAQPERKNWRYDPEMLPWWSQFANVNLTGKLPPKPEEAPAPVEPEKPKDTGIPLDDILVIESLLLEVSQSSDQVTHAVVRYKPNVEVHPPQDPAIAAAAGTGRPAAWGPGDAARPASGAGPSPAVPLPSGPTTEVRQFVHLDETLWPPHDNVRLVRISEDAQSAFFAREDPTKDRSEWKVEEVFKNELELDPAVVKALGQAVRAGKQGQPDDTPAPPAEVSDWRDVPQTAEVEPGQIHISRSDHDYVRDNIDRVFNEEVAVTPYRAKVGNYEGLRVDRVPPRLQQFGLQPGDVILSVNGEKVKHKTQAYTVAKRQYGAGTRRFVVEVLSGMGTGVRTITYSVPPRS